MSVRIGRDLKGPFITTGNPDTVNDAPSTVTTVGGTYDLAGQLGAIFRATDGSGREWIYAKYSSTSTGTLGVTNNPCYWIANSTANMASPGQWVFDTNTTANTGTVAFASAAGILRSTGTITRGNHYWLLRKSGQNFVQITGTTTVANAVGDPVVTTASSSNATVISSSSTVLGTSPVVIGQWRWGVLASTATGLTFVGTTSTQGLSVFVPTYLDLD